MRTRLRPGAILTVLAALGLLASTNGCSQDQASTLTGVRTVTVKSASSALSPGDLDHRYFRRARIAGPHYSLGIRWVGTGDEFDAQPSVDLHIRPAEGKELLIAAVDPNFTNAPYKPQRVQVTAVVGHHATKLSGLPLPPPDAVYGAAPTDTQLIAVSALPDTPVRLRATDDGRTQELDLRTGKVLTHNGYQLHRSDADWDGETTVARSMAGRRHTATLEVSNYRGVHGKLSASLTNYLPKSGWAPHNRAFLAVGMPLVRCDTTAFVRAHAEFDDPDVFTFRPANGKAAVPRASDRDLRLGVPDISRQDRPTPVMFTVPADITTGTVVMDLSKVKLTEEVGESSVQTPSDKRKTISWLTPPDPFTLSLKLTN